MRLLLGAQIWEMKVVTDPQMCCLREGEREREREERERERERERREREGRTNDKWCPVHPTRPCTQPARRQLVFNWGGGGRGREKPIAKGKKRYID